MNPPIKAESSLAAIDGETGVDKTTSSFSLPFRAPQKTLHTKLAPLSNIHSTQVQNYDKERDNLMTSIVNTYSANRLGLTLWTYKVWGKRATDIIHAATSILCALGSAISDVLIPVCKSEVCSTQGHTMAKDGTTRLPTSELTTCENCGNKSNMKLCAGCRFASKYCINCRSLNEVLICNQMLLREIRKSPHLGRRPEKHGEKNIGNLD